MLVIGVRLVLCKYTTGEFSPESGCRGLGFSLALVQPKKPGLVVAVVLCLNLELTQQQVEGN